MLVQDDNELLTFGTATAFPGGVAGTLCKGTRLALSPTELSHHSTVLDGVVAEPPVAPTQSVILPCLTWGRREELPNFLLREYFALKRRHLYPSKSSRDLKCKEDVEQRDMETMRLANRGFSPEHGLSSLDEPGSGPRSVPTRTGEGPLSYRLCRHGGGSAR